jgi:hypothetical protein
MCICTYVSIHAGCLFLMHYLYILSVMLYIYMQGVLVGKLVGATFVAAYAVKYGQLATGLGFEPSAPAALAMVLVPPVNLLC